MDLFLTGNSGVLKKRQKKRNPAFGADRASDDPDDSDYDPSNPPGSECRNEQNRKFDEKNTKANTKSKGGGDKACLRNFHVNRILLTPFLLYFVYFLLNFLIFIDVSYDTLVM